MKKTLILLAIVFSVALQAQEISKTEKIKTLFSIMHQDTLVVKSIDIMSAAMLKNMETVFNDPKYSKQGIDIKAWTKKLSDRSMQKAKDLALKLLHNDMVTIYDKYFSVSEIDDFTVFYKSTSGQKLLTSMPEITKDIMKIMTSQFQSEFQQTLLKDIEEMTLEIEQSKKKK